MDLLRRGLMAQRQTERGTHDEKRNFFCCEFYDRCRGSRTVNGPATATDPSAGHQHLLCDHRAGKSLQQGLRLSGLERVARAGFVGRSWIQCLRAQSALFAGGNVALQARSLSEPELV